MADSQSGAADQDHRHEEQDWETSNSEQTDSDVKTAKRTRSGGRKSLNPTKLVHRYKYNTTAEPYHEESKQPSEAGYSATAVRMSEDDTVDAVVHDDNDVYDDGLGDAGGSIMIQPMKWDKRMRLTVNKDYTKQRKQPQLVKSATSDSGPAENQRIFNCLVCQQPFLDAAECYNHMLTHTLNAGQSGNFTQSENLQSMERESDTQSVSDAGEEREEADSDEADTEDEASIDRDLVLPVTGDNSSSGKRAKRVFALRDMEKGFECQQCRKRFTEQRGLSQHMRVHVKNKSLTCPVCSVVLASYFLLAEHKRLHSGERPFKCAFVGCDRYFPDAHQARRHGRMHSKERPFVCTHCDKAFKAPNHLQEHLRLHTGERPFVCEVCGLGFAQSNGLKSHAKQHAIRVDNECDICCKSFPHPQSLALHKQAHVNDRPFACELCNKTFRTSCNLGAHRKLKHLDEIEEKQFTCTDCGATFSKACNLGIHRKKKHSNLPAEPPKIFICNICDARFSEACNLGAHKKIKHAEESGNGRSVFDCTICGARFYRACNLSGHMRRKHGGTKGAVKESEKHYKCQECGLPCSSLKELQDHYIGFHPAVFPVNNLAAFQGADKVMVHKDDSRIKHSIANDLYSSCDRITESSQAQITESPSAATPIVEARMAEDRESVNTVCSTTSKVPHAAIKSAEQDSGAVQMPSTTRYQQSTERTLLEKIWPQLRKSTLNLNSAPQKTVAQSHGIPSLRSSQHSHQLTSDISRPDFHAQQRAMYQASSWNNQQLSSLRAQSFSKPSIENLHSSVFPNSLLPSKEPVQKEYEQPVFPHDAGMSISASNVVDSFLQDVFNAQ